MGRNLVYPKVDKNTVHRKNDRGKLFLYSNVRQGTLAMVELVDLLTRCNHYPSADLNEPLDCYLHGYVSSGIMKKARSASEEGLPMTLAATKVDGIVLSLTPNSHSYNYRSAVLFGYGSLVEDTEEKLWAMQVVTNSVVPGRWDQTRSPPDGSEMASTTILKVKIANGSGKIRTGGPGDDKKDTEREDVIERVWTGVVPIWETVGEPVHGGAGRVVAVPEHVRHFQKDVNESNEEYAKTAAQGKGSAGKGY